MEALKKSGGSERYPNILRWIGGLKGIFRSKIHRTTHIPKPIEAKDSAPEIGIPVEITITTISHTEDGEFTDANDSILELRAVAQKDNDFFRKIEFSIPSRGVRTILLISSNDLSTKSIEDRMNKLPALNQRMDRDLPIPHVKNRKFPTGTWQQLGEREEFDFEGTEQWPVHFDPNGQMILPDYLEKYRYQSNGRVS